MNAPAIAPEIKQEAARSLLERLGEKTALVRFFRYNASAKHGVPIDSPRELAIGGTDSSTTSDTTTTTTTDTVNPAQPVQPVQPVSPTGGQNGQAGQAGQANQPNISVNLSQPQSPSSGNDYLKGALITLATLAGLGGAIAIGYMLASPADKETPAVVAPAEPIKEPVQETPKIQQSPLQFLEDIGAHIP